MAELTKDKLINLKDKYLNAINLSNEVSKNDPPEEPYKSKYAAKKILSEILVDLEGTNENEESKGTVKNLEVKRALLNYEIGLIDLDANDLSAAKLNFELCLPMVDNSIVSRESCILSINLYNSYGILLTKRQNINMAKDALIKAESIYDNYMKEKCAEAPFLPEAILYCDAETTNPNKAWESLEMSHTYTHFYLAQVYEQLGEMDLSSKYLHKTIKKQLRHSNLDHIEWAINSATLSKYYIPKDKYKIAKHYLTCSNHILSKYETILTNTADDSEEYLEKLEVLKYCKARVANNWINYYTSLLYCSAKRLQEMQSPDLLQPDLNKDQELISDPEIKKYENQVVSTLARNYDEAKCIFLEAQKWLEEAKKQFTLDDHASDHVELVQNHSKLYNLLATFEKDPQNACKMHKRRADLLEPLLSHLNPQYYIVLCRLLMFELGEIFQVMLDLKRTIMNQEKTNSQHPVKKINMLVRKSIHYFIKFIDSCKDIKTKALPKPFPVNVAHALLVGHFYLGRLPTKIITYDPEEKLRNLKLSQQYYQYLVDYISEHPEHNELIKEEFTMTKQMLALLTTQINKLSETTQE